jgi:hypothetical protein
VAVPCLADTPNDLHKQLPARSGRLKIKLSVGGAAVGVEEQDIVYRS